MFFFFVFIEGKVVSILSYQIFLNTYELTVPNDHGVCLHFVVTGNIVDSVWSNNNI